MLKTKFVFRTFTTFSSMQFRKCATSLRRPIEIFSKDLPPPPPWPKTNLNPPLSSQLVTACSLQWNESTKDAKTLTKVLSRFQTMLRSVHKQKIVWPADEFDSSELSINEYLRMLLQPLADFYNQLYCPLTLKPPMETERIDFGDSIHGVTFIIENVRREKVSTPIILSLPDDLFSSNGKISPRLDYFLSKALEYKPLTPSIIVTNFKDTAVFLPPNPYHHQQPTFERIRSTQPFLALRIISAAYLEDALPPGSVNYPNPIMEDYDEDLILPAGPPQNPHQPLLPDEQVFETHHRHSDFDYATLVRDRTRALQFFRWHKHVQQQYTKLQAKPNDILTAVTNEIGLAYPTNIYPIYPFNTSEIPTDTATHLTTIQRQSPLISAGIFDSFMRSKSFTLKLENILSEGSERTICTVYRCLITSIDGEPVSSSPSFCLKLFDDRFQDLGCPTEDYEEGFELPLHLWFRRVIIAQLYALTEAFAYDKLRPVQGSVIPWFYGTHQFTLPDGTVLSGLLMEYIDGFALHSDVARELSPSRQIKMIQSLRHAIRVLDIADVSQRDWHEGQILLYTNPTTKIDHIILIDFASTTQTWQLDEPNYLANYFESLHILSNDSGFDQELVWKHFGEPDDWDSIVAVFHTASGRRDVRARNMFPYITSA